MLKEVQVPVTLGYRVVDRMLSGQSRNREASASAEVHADRQRARLGIEIGLGHKPGGADPQRRLEQFLAHSHQLDLRSGP